MTVLSFLPLLMYTAYCIMHKICQFVNHFCVTPIVLCRPIGSNFWLKFDREGPIRGSDRFLHVNALMKDYTTPCPANIKAK